MLGLCVVYLWLGQTLVNESTTFRECTLLVPNVRLALAWRSSDVYSHTLLGKTLTPPPPPQAERKRGSLRARRSDSGQSGRSRNNINNLLLSNDTTSRSRTILRYSNAGSRSSSPCDNETGPVSQRVWYSIQHIPSMCMCENFFLWR